MKQPNPPELNKNQAEVPKEARKALNIDRRVPDPMESIRNLDPQLAEDLDALYLETHPDLGIDKAFLESKTLTIVFNYKDISEDVIWAESLKIQTSHPMELTEVPDYLVVLQKTYAKRFQVIQDQPEVLVEKARNFLKLHRALKSLNERVRNVKS